MQLAFFLRYAGVLIAVYLTGCTAIATRQQVAEFQRPAGYEKFYRQLDESVKAAGVRDAAEFKVNGFPYF